MQNKASNIIFNKLYLFLYTNIGRTKNNTLKQK